MSEPSTRPAWPCQSRDVRWRFPDPNDVSETERRTALLLAIDRFWQQFLRAAPEIAASFSRAAEFDIPEFMDQHLSTIDPRLMWEYGRAVRGVGHRLVLTPESDRELRPLVEALLARAPSLPAWEFYAHRLAEDFEEAIATVAGRTEVDVSSWQVQVTLGEHHLLELKWLLPPGTQGEQLEHAAFVLSEALLGEETMDTWIGEIIVEEAARPRVLSRLFGRSEANSDHQSPATLKARVESLVTALDRELPAEPQSSVDPNGGVEYTLYSLEPKEQEDYAGRFDLITSVTRGLPEMWQAAHSNLAFCSRRFSRHGETFCYVKLDGRDSADHGDLDAREKIEEALNEVLRPGGLGSVVGGGTGRRYMYVDLALRHLDHGLAELRRTLQRLAVPERSWLLFFDAHLADEWLGIYDSTPPPATAEADDA